MKFFTGSITDKGAYRPNNEDSILVRIHEEESHSFCIGVVCDGIGGLDGGEISSDFLISHINTWFNRMVLNPEDPAQDDMREFLRIYSAQWNEQLIDHLQMLGIKSGSTMSLLYLDETHMVISHVGDSRIYRYSPEAGLQQLTTDATVQKLNGGKMRSYLDNYMGKEIEWWTDILDESVFPGELFLFGSDGFYHFLQEEDVREIYDRIENGENATVLCRQAMQKMLERGERDNISVGVIYIADEKRAEKISKKTARMFRIHRQRNLSDTEDLSCTL